jgi:hypothetical protein
MPDSQVRECTPCQGAWLAAKQGLELGFAPFVTRMGGHYKFSKDLAGAWPGVWIPLRCPEQTAGRKGLGSDVGIIGTGRKGLVVLLGVVCPWNGSFSESHFLPHSPRPSLPVF